MVTPCICAFHLLAPAGRQQSRFRAIFRQEVARLVDDPAEVEDELVHLFIALG